MWVNTPKEVQDAFMRFYRNLFCSKNDTRSLILKSITHRGPRLSDAHKNQLSWRFNLADVKRVLDDIPSNKTPGLDGFNSHFYKCSWDIIKNDLHAAINDFFTTGKMLREINVTWITLIPKISVPSSVSHFRPIAWCSVLYKCISKLLCEKLGSVLPDIISCNQGAFVSGRSILHNTPKGAINNTSLIAFMKKRCHYYQKSLIGSVYKKPLSF